MAANPFDQFSFAAPAVGPPPSPMYQQSGGPQPQPGGYEYQQNPAQQPNYNQNPYGGSMTMMMPGEQQPPMAPPPQVPIVGNPYDSNPFGGGGHDAAGVLPAVAGPGSPGGGSVAAPVADGQMLDNPFAMAAAAPPQADLGQAPNFATAAAEGGPFGVGAPPPPPHAAPPGAPDAVYADPWGGPTAGAPPPPPPPQQQMSYGAPPSPQQMRPQMQMPGGGQPDPSLAGALVPSDLQSNPYAQQNPYGAPPPQQPPQNPYGPPVPPAAAAYGQQQITPYGYPPAVGPYGQPAYGAPPPPAPIDPFSVFESQKIAAPPAPEPFSTAIVPAQSQQLQQPPLQPGAAPRAAGGEQDEDFWGSFSATTPAAAESAAPEESNKASPTRSKTPRDAVDGGEEKKTTDNLPPGGEWYDARIFTPTLGVMFFKPQELTDSLFLNTDKSIIDGLGERPVVAFIVEGSSARSAGVELGHVLLKVNGVDVKNPKEASRLIKEGPRPLPLLFYVPNTDVVVAEGEHMVKYDTRETTAPNSAKDWKPKYVVIGGIIAQPWMMNMYRSKSEYDIAVIETQARRPVSVKVKQFSLQGARIQNDWQGPQMVKYKNKLHPWKYIVVLPVARNPIKISSPNLSTLKPVHEGIRRVLLAQQRDGGRSSSSSHRAAAAQDYRSDGGSDRGDQYARSSGSQNGHDGGGGNVSGGGAYNIGNQGYNQQPPPQQQAGYVQQSGYRY